MKAYELLSDPSKWTKGVIARNSNGERVAGYDPSATCFCLYGAIKRCYPGYAAEETFSRIQECVPDRDAIGWNDAPERTYDEVITLLKELDI
jgi:hypothetical protein